MLGILDNYGLTSLSNKFKFFPLFNYKERTFEVKVEEMKQKKNFL